MMPAVDDVAIIDVSMPRRRGSVGARCARDAMLRARDSDAAERARLMPAAPRLPRLRLFR